MSSPPTSRVHALRRAWKPTKLALGDDHPTSIRLHRALSWMRHVEELGDEAPPDTALVHHWIAFNALYGQWDESRRMPLSDRKSWSDFLTRVLELDVDGRIGAMLEEHRPLVMKILENEFLSDTFWTEPGESNARRAMRARHEAPTWYHGRQWWPLLSRPMDRIYLLRCQLVHGAATFGSGLNRTSLKHCNIMLGHVLGAVLHVMIDRGGDEDWGAMCYPPLE